MTSPAAQAIVAAGYIGFLVVGVVLSVIDIRTHRLPHRIVLPSYPIALAVLAVSCLAGMPWARLGGAVAGMLVMAAFYALLRVLSRRGMGGGDVTLAGLIGIFLGWQGWGAVFIGLLAAFVLGGVYSLMLILARRAQRRTAIPFGPWMVAGAWIGVLTGARLGSMLVALPA